ncbi:hypothetical protein K2173_007759 [Erythroxylum novogranatense]|nr:hypothetical protein K2173_007759 [Erythroxylum novogranatense]
MSAAGKAWIVATSIGAVEALKDQGVCRWNYTMRSMIQHAQNKLRAYSQYNTSSTASSSSSSTVATSSSTASSAKESSHAVSVTNKREERVRKVMDISSWGPSTVRF